MDTQFPAEVSSVVKFLEEQGFSAVDVSDLPYFGSRSVILTDGRVNVRLVSDRGRWAIDVGPEGARDEWYDLPLVEEELRREIGPDILTFEEESNLLRQHLSEIRSAISGPGSRQVRSDLDQRRRKRVKRRFPSLS